MTTNERTAYIGPKDLKPCPLCGGPASVYEYTAGVFWTTPTVEATRIGCDRCGLEIRGDGAARAWNTRAERTCHDANTRFDAWTCSECKCTQLLMFNDFYEPTLSVDGVASVPNYCPNCGAKMVE